MTDEELIKFLRTSTNACFNKTAADRIEALVKYRDAYAEMDRIATEALRKSETRAERLAATNERLEAAMRAAISEVSAHFDAVRDDNRFDEGWQAAVMSIDAAILAALKGADHE